MNQLVSLFATLLICFYSINIEARERWVAGSEQDEFTDLAKRHYVRSGFAFVPLISMGCKSTIGSYGVILLPATENHPASVNEIHLRVDDNPFLKLPIMKVDEDDQMLHVTFKVSSVEWTEAITQMKIGQSVKIGFPGSDVFSIGLQGSSNAMAEWKSLCASSNFKSVMDTGDQVITSTGKWLRTTEVSVSATTGIRSLSINVIPTSEESQTVLETYKAHEWRFVWQCTSENNYNRKYTLFESATVNYLMPGFDPSDVTMEFIPYGDGAAVKFVSVPWQDKTSFLASELEPEAWENLLNLMQEDETPVRFKFSDSNEVYERTIERSVEVQRLFRDWEAQCRSEGMW